MQASTPSEHKNMFDKLMDDTPASSSEDELQCYLSTYVEDMKDALMWWSERCAMFPRLSRMACDYLVIPGEYLVFLCLSGAEPYVTQPQPLMLSACSAVAVWSFRMSAAVLQSN